MPRGDHNGWEPYIGPYVVFGELGRGGMGVVYAARDPKLNRKVALKVLHGQFPSTTLAAQRLRREAEAIARLDHENIVPIYEVGEHDGQPFLAMGLVEGQSLAAAICERQPPMSPRQAAALTSKIARAVQHAHDRGVLHRDLKPGNILLDEARQPHLIDFGLAKSLNHESAMTLTGTFLGTPAYASPEQSAGKTRLITTSTDVYSLGAVLYAILTGREPFQGETSSEIIEAVQNKSPIPVRTLRPEVSPNLETICLKCLEKEPARRYPSALTLAEDLERFLEGKPITARPTNLPERVWMWAHRRPGVAATLAATGLALIAAVIAIVWGWRTSLALTHLQSAAMAITVGNPRIAGWSTDSWNNLMVGSTLKTRSNFRDQAGASLEGLDGSRRFAPQVSPFEQIVFRSDGKLVLAGPEGARIVQPSSNFNVLAKLGAPPGNVLGFAAATPLQVLRQESGRLCVWHITEERILCDLHFPAGLSIHAPTNALVAACQSGQRLGMVLVNTQSSAVLGCWEIPRGGAPKLIEVGPFPTALALSEDGSWIALGQQTGQISLLGPDFGNGAESIGFSRLPVRSVAFGTSSLRLDRDKTHGPNLLLAAGDEGGSLAIWDLADRRQVALNRGNQHALNSLVFSPDRVTLISGGPGPSMLWDVATGAPLIDLDVDHVVGFTFSPDGRAVAGVKEHTELNCWELRNGRGVSELRGLSGGVMKPVFSADRTKVAAASMNWQVAVWNVSQGQLLRVLEREAGVSADNIALVFSPDGQRLAYCAGEEAGIWELQSGQRNEIWRLPRGFADTLAWPRGKSLYCLRCENGTLWLRNLLSGKEPLREMPGFQQPFAAAVTSDGRYFAFEGLNDFGTMDQRNNHRTSESVRVGLAAATPGNLQTGSSPHNLSIPLVRNKAPHLIFVLEADSGRTVWSTATTSTQNWARLIFASEGHWLGFSTDGTTQDLINLASNDELRRLNPASEALGPQARLSMRKREGGNGRTLYQDANSVFSLGIYSKHEDHPQFDSTGRYLAWGRSDGRLSLYDLQEIERQLAHLGVFLKLREDP